MPNMKQQHTLKPLLKIGDEVTAAWWPPSTPDISEVAPSGWYRGVISSYKTLHPTNNTSSNNCYGPVRFYSVNFDDGDVGSDIPEHFVFLQDEYEIMTMKDDDDDDEDIVWKGVRTVTDRHSDDPWAKHVGWYVATIDGEDHTFSLLSDALRAYDSFVVSTKGFKTKKEHLNLPGDWDKLFRDKAKGEKHKLEIEELEERHDKEMEKLRVKAEVDQESAVRMAVVKEERKVREVQHKIKIEYKEQSKKEMEKLKRQYEQENVRRLEEEARAEKQKLKPRYQVGEEVYAAWWPDDKKKDEQPLWYPGRVKSYRDQRVGTKGVGEYGVVRLYKVVYTDDGTEQENIPEHFVFPKEDYLLSTSNGIHHEWKGVRNFVDKASEDVWASLIGYYVAIIDGKEQSFPRLSEALQAYDASIAKRKGDKTKQSDLNIPDNWGWLLTPNAPAPPTVEELMEELHETRLKITEQEKMCVKSFEEKHDTEKELAVKAALAEERRRTQDMKRKLRKELTGFHENEMKRARQMFEGDKTKAIEMALSNARKEQDLSLEKQRGDLEQHFNYEKDKAMQFVKLETRQQLKSEMQAEFNNLKNEIEKEIEQRLRTEYSLPPPPKRAKVSLSLIPRSAFGMSSPKPTEQKGKENMPEGDSLLTPTSEKSSAEDEAQI